MISKLSMSKLLYADISKKKDICKRDRLRTQPEYTLNTMCTYPFHLSRKNAKAFSMAANVCRECVECMMSE